MASENKHWCSICQAYGHACRDEIDSKAKDTDVEIKTDEKEYTLDVSGR